MRLSLKLLDRDQRKGVHFICKHPHCALFADMGVGKTVITLAAFKVLRNKGKAKRLLIVAPKRVATYTWADEIEKWEELADMRVSVAAGKTAVKRWEALDADSDIYTINYDNFYNMVKRYTKDWKWDMVVFDESSAFKTSDTKRFKAASALRISGVANRIVMLTGTPTPNGYHELWPQLYLLDRGERLGKTKKRFLSDWFDMIPMEGQRQPKYVLKGGKKEALFDRIGDVVLRLSASKKKGKPDVRYVTDFIELPKKARDAYERMEQQFYLEVADADVFAAAESSKMLKLLQIANGFVYDEEGVTHHIHDAKIEALLELVEDNPSFNFLIAYSFKADLKKLQKALSPYGRVEAFGGKENPNIVKDWNAGRIRFLLAHPMSAGHGLNLQQGGHVIVWYAPTWSLESYQQFNARLARRGQPNPFVMIRHIIAKDTIDELVLQTLQRKGKLQDALLNYLQEKHG